MDDPFRLRNSQANRAQNGGIEAFLLKMASVTNLRSGRSALRRWTIPAKSGGLLLLLLSGAALSMTGCASPVRLFHEAEGGDIATLRQPPPGSELPYPNLASVPAAPAALTAYQKALVQQRLSAAKLAPSGPAGANVAASPETLSGLTLPGAAPPYPDVPGVNWQGLPQAEPPPPPPAPAMAPKPPDGPPILLAFRPQSALLTLQAKTALTALAQARGKAGIRVGGFGEQNAAEPDAASLSLALYRARRIADALTAAGVPPKDITLVASAAGSGGFAQLVY